MEHIYSVEIELSKEEYEGLKDMLRVVNMDPYKDNERTLPWLVHKLVEIGADTLVEMVKKKTATMTLDPGEDKL